MSEEDTNRRLDKLEEQMERTMSALTELAHGAEVSHIHTKTAQATLEDTLKVLKKQNRYILSIVAAVVTSGGPDLVLKVGKLVMGLAGVGH